MNASSSSEAEPFRRRHLPHWMVEEHPYFVTIRLKGSLPIKVVRELERERDAIVSSGGSRDQLYKFQQRRFKRIESILDSVTDDNQSLCEPRIAQLLLDSCDWLQDELAWTIFAVTIMPNHLHLLLQNMKDRNAMLNHDLGRFKSYTAKQANRILERTGSLWQDENFDHWVRNEDKFIACRRYIMNNPVKAGLVENWSDWPWIRILSPEPDDPT